MKEVGLTVVNDTQNGWEESFDQSMSIDEFSNYQVDPDVFAVVGGMSYSFNYRSLCIASLYIQVNDALFIATNSDRVYPSNVPERKCPAGGSIVSAIAS